MRRKSGRNLFVVEVTEGGQEVPTQGRGRPPKLARPSPGPLPEDYNPAYANALIEHVAQPGNNIGSFAESIGVTRNKLYYWRASVRAFYDAFSAVRQIERERGPEHEKTSDKRGRPSKYDPSYPERLIEHVARPGNSITSFAASIGVHRATLLNWKEKEPAFFSAFMRAREIETSRIKPGNSRHASGPRIHGHRQK